TLSLKGRGSRRRFVAGEGEVAVEVVEVFHGSQVVELVEFVFRWIVGEVPLDFFLAGDAVHDAGGVDRGVGRGEVFDGGGGAERGGGFCRVAMVAGVRGGRAGGRGGGMGGWMAG